MSPAQIGANKGGGIFEKGVYSLVIVVILLSCLRRNSGPRKPAPRIRSSSLILFIAPIKFNRSAKALYYAKERHPPN